MKWSNDLNLRPDDLNVQFESMRHKDLNFEYSGSNALSSAWTRLLEIKNPIQADRWEEALLNASYYLWVHLRMPEPSIIPVFMHIDDIHFTVKNPGTLRSPGFSTNSLTQIHFTFELQERVSYERVINFLKNIATKHFEINHHVTTLTIAITKKNDKNIMVAIDTVHNEVELAFLIQSLDDRYYFHYAHPILQRVLSRMIIAYISKESIRYVEESMTDSIYKRVGFVCNEDGSIQGTTLGDNEEGYGEWNIILPEQVVSQTYYRDKYSLDYQKRSNYTPYEENLEVFEDPVQCPYEPTQVSVNQVVDYITKMTMEYFRQEMMNDVNFYTKMSHFLTDIRNFATGKK